MRLLGEADRHGNDPELFAGLVHACRYCGLYEQSIAAHDEARRLDPNVPTSLEQTMLMTGDIERLLAVELPPLVGGRRRRRSGSSASGWRAAATRRARRCSSMRRASRIPAFQVVDRLPAGLARPAARGHARRACRALGGLKIMDDPEAIFQEGWLLCDVGEHERGLELPAARGRQGLLRRADPRRAAGSSTRCAAIPRFQELLAEAEAGRQQALAAFREAGGERLLGPRTGRAASGASRPCSNELKTDEE